MVKSIKGDADSQLSKSIRESAHLVWLAGLGAFAKVGEEGGKLFEALVEEGEKLEERTREAAGSKLAAVGKKTGETRDKVVDAWDKVERLFEDRLARVLGRLGIPGRDDLLELNRRVEALRARIDGLARRRPDAILVAGDSVATTWRADAIERANAARIAIVYYWPGTAEAGALFSYQADVRDNYRRAAGYVDRILKGTAPGDLPVYQPDRYELVVNARVARELGVDLPKSFLLRADRVIQ